MKTFKQYIEEQSIRDQLPSYDELDLRSRMQVDQDDYEGGPPVPPGEEDDFEDFRDPPKPKKPNDSTGFTYTGNWWTDFLQAWNAS